MFNNERTVMRLQQMKVKARNASQAEALLSHLAVFQEPFGRSAIVGLAPKGMDDPIRIVAFATLRSWNIVKQISSKRFYVEASIRELFPSTDAIRLEQLNFFIGCVSVYDQIWAQLRWADLSSALQWGLKYQPSLGLELAQKIRHNMQFSSSNEHITIMESIYRVASLVRHLDLQIYAINSIHDHRVSLAKFGRLHRGI